MPSFTAKDIPPQALPDLKKIAELEESLFEQFLAAIIATGPALTSVQLGAQVLEKVPLLKKDDAKAMLRIIFFLYSIMRDSKMELSPQELAQEIANSPPLAAMKGFLPENKMTLSTRLSRMLSFPKSVGVSSKALEVMTRHDHVFCDARILSDIRPVFAENPDTADAAVIIHNLEIGFHQNGRHLRFYVALDTGDLQKLKQVIERAEKKTDALESILNKSNTPYLEVKI